MSTKYLIIFVLICSISTVVQAQIIQNISFQDLDGDNDPDLAIIETDFSTNHDKVLVYDHDDDMIESQDWKICCDFDSDIWIFDVGSDGDAELIIDFGKKDGKLDAYLYDDTTGDGKVSYFYNTTSFEVVESNYPTLTVIAEDGFWTKNNKINYNLKMLGDGEVDIGQVYHRKKGVNDGKVDFRITIYDTDGDLDQDYELRESLIDLNINDTSKDTGSMLMIDYDDNEVKWKNFIFWPYLGSGPGSWERGYNSASPPILIDWKNAKIFTIQVMVSDRFDDGNCFILTPNAILRNEVNFLPFENPFCFYDLANDNDGIPEAVARVVQPQPERVNKSEVEYNWDQNNDGRLDFAIFGYGGIENLYRLEKDKYVSVIDFPDFSFITIPFEEVPFWIFDKNWNSATYVETNGLWGVGEGVYGFTFTKFLPAKVGFKGEHTLDLNENLKLYLSPIDKELHLMSAQEGIYLLSAKKTGKFRGGDFSKDEYWTGNITVLKAIEYKNLNFDSYIDKWTYLENDLPVKNLIYSNGFLIYSEKNKEIKLMKTEINQSIFETIPPRNHQELEIFKRKLSDQGWKLRNFNDKLIYEEGIVSVDQSKIQVADFESMFNQFSGELITIENGYLSDFSLTDNGFMFTLNCKLECKIDSFTEIDYDKPLTQGEYLLVYDNGIFTIKLNKPDLYISEIKFDKTSPKELESVKISAVIRNRGVADADSVVVQFFDIGLESGRVLIGNKTLKSITSETSKKASVSWVPTGGSHEIHVKIDPENLVQETNEENNIAFKPVYILPLKQPTALERLMMGGGERTLIFISIMIFGMLFLALYISKLILKD